MASNDFHLLVFATLWNTLPLDLGWTCDLLLMNRLWQQHWDVTSRSGLQRLWLLSWLHSLCLSPWVFWWSELPWCEQHYGEAVWPGTGGNLQPRAWEEMDLANHPVCELEANPSPVKPWDDWHFGCRLVWDPGPEAPSWALPGFLTQRS